MRLLLSFLGLLLLTAAAPTPTPTRDWSTVAVKTPAGAYLIGNPAAKVKLVEYASYTCSHCAEFAVESAPVLKERMIRSGSTSLELRHLIRDRIDLAAAILARCAGPRGFAATSAAIFTTQPQWLAQGIEFQQANATRLQMYPMLAQLRAYADGSGLTALARARGLTAAQVDACFADQAEVDRILAITAAAPAEVDSTPTFFVNGKVAPHVGWAKLEPILRAAGAR